VARSRQLRKSHVAAIALALVAALVALIGSPANVTPRIGDPQAGFWNVPASEAPVPDRPEHPELAAAAAIVRAEHAPCGLRAILCAPIVPSGSARDGVRPRVERPPAA